MRQRHREDGQQHLKMYSLQRAGERAVLRLVAQRTYTCHPSILPPVTDLTKHKLGEHKKS